MAFAVNGVMAEIYFRDLEKCAVRNRVIVAVARRWC